MNNNIGGNIDTTVEQMVGLSRPTLSDYIEILDNFHTRKSDWDMDRIVNQVIIFIFCIIININCFFSYFTLLKKPLRKSSMK